MPSLSDLTEKKLGKYEIVLKVFEDNFGEIHDPDDDDNFGYYALFQAFKLMGKT